MAKHGGRRKGAGRKSKAEEQQLIEKLTPYEDAAIKKLGAAVRRGDQWAIKLFMEYMYGKPAQRIDHTTGGDKLTPPPPIVFQDFTDEEQDNE